MGGHQRLTVHWAEQQQHGRGRQGRRGPRGPRWLRGGDLGRRRGPRTTSRPARTCCMPSEPSPALTAVAATDTPGAPPAAIGARSAGHSAHLRTRDGGVWERRWLSEGTTSAHARGKAGAGTPRCCIRCTAVSLSAVSAVSAVCVRLQCCPAHSIPGPLSSASTRARWSRAWLSGPAAPL
jgi:hypothetical protein